jgi:hypothetical protein
MTTLTDFLLARIAEDEAAVAAILRQHPSWTADDGDVLDQPEYAIAHARGNYAASHIARWDPARVLAESEAKRSVVELHRTDATDPEVIVCAVCLYGPPCETLRLLALPYADHPDYRPEWRP